MNRKRRGSKRQAGPTESTDRIVLICVLIAVGLIPLLVHGKIQFFVIPVIDPITNLSTGSLTDLFTYYKSIALIIVAIILLLWFLANIVTSRQKIKLSKLNVPIFVFVLAICLSVLFSDYKSYAIWGGQARNFGAAAYLSFILIFFVLINSKADNSWERKIILVLIPLAIINSLMMLISFYGINLWDNTILKALIAGEAAPYLNENSRILGTLGHWNYLSGLGSILFAVFAGKAVFSVRKLLFDWERIVYILTAVLSANLAFASKALSGVVTILFVTTLLLGVIIETRKKEGINLLIIIALTILSCAVLSLHDATFLHEFISDAFILGFSVLLGIIFFGVYLLLKNWERLNKRKALYVSTTVVIICILISIALAPTVVEEVTTELERMNSELIRERLEKNPFDFPEAKFGWGTGRIYIWEKTLELIAKKPLVGYGLDTLLFEFDQGDPAKIAALEKANTVVDKPHNVYINMLYGAGVIAFLAFLAIVVLVIWRALKAFSTESEYCYMIWPLLLGVLAYLYQGMFNDPVQGVEQIFWVLMGLTYALADKAGVSKREELSKRL